MNLPARFALNPVTLKELRQMVRSRLVSGGLIAHLFLQLAVVALVVLASKDIVADLFGEGLGKVVFGVSAAMLALMALLAIPSFIGTRLAAERNAAKLDLQFITVLAPTQFIDGKIAAAGIITLLFASTSLPFMMLAYLLRGVDVFMMLRIFASILAAGVGASYLALVFGSLNISKAFRILFVVGLVQVALPMGGALAVAGATTEFHLGQAVLALAGIATVCAIARAFAAAGISPPHANSAYLLRRVVLAAWILWGAIAFIAAFVCGEASFGVLWGVLSMVAAGFMLLHAVSSKSGNSRRVLAEASRRFRIRLLQYPLFTGAENGIAFAVLLGVATLVGFVGFASLAEASSRLRGSDTGEALVVLALLLTYPAAYLLSARLVWERFLRGAMNARYVGVLGLGLGALLSSLPYLLTIQTGGTAQNVAQLFPGNLAGALFSVENNDGQALMHILVAAAWSLGCLLLLMPRLRRSFADFRPPLAAVQPAAVASAEPPLPACETLPEPPPLPPAPSPADLD